MNIASSVIRMNELVEETFKIHKCRNVTPLSERASNMKYRWFNKFREKKRNIAHRLVQKKGKHISIYSPNDDYKGYKRDYKSDMWNLWSSSGKEDSCVEIENIEKNDKSILNKTFFI